MPLPLIGMGIAAAAAVGTGLIGAIKGHIDTGINPAMLFTRYAAQRQFQSSMPDTTMGLTAWLNGRITTDQLTDVFQYNNYPLFTTGNAIVHKFSDSILKEYITSLIPKLSMEQLMYCYYAGIIDDVEYNELGKSYKIRKEFATHFQEMLYAKFDGNVIINNFFRGIWDKEQTITKLRKFYGCYDNHAKDILQSSQFIPPPGDLIRFAVKGVYNPDEIKEFELDAEFDEIKEGIAWANATGIGEATIKDKDGNVITKDIFKQYWMAHWQLISPSQGFEALHRLRPNRMARYTDKVPDLTPFEFKQLNILLKAQDYVPKQRKWLAAISYHQLGRIDLRRLFNSEIIDETELYEQYQDLGYVASDANMLLQFSVKDKKEKDKLKKEKEAKTTYGKLASQIYLAYRDGAIGRDLAYARLMLIFDDDALVTANIDAIDIDINRHRVLQYIKMVKDEFFLGLYDGVQAVSELLQGGVNDIRASQYVIRWQRQLSRPRRVASINTVLDWYKRILITFDDAAARLSNLGVSNNETLLYLQAGQQDIQKALIQEQNRLARTEKQKVEESKRLLRELQANHRSAKSDLRTYSNINDMKRWFLTGLIEEYEVRERMNFLDIPTLDQDRILTEWKG